MQHATRYGERASVWAIKIGSRMYSRHACTHIFRSYKKRMLMYKDEVMPQNHVPLLCLSLLTAFCLQPGMSHMPDCSCASAYWQASML
eukprot:scaffold104942_cov18-Tisochrysis_lutea.AAC.8